MRRRVRGDLLAFPTAKGLSYVQYCFGTYFYGEMVRVIEGLFPEDPPGLEAHVERPTLFWIPIPLGSALYRKEVRYVGNVPFPKNELIPPWVKASGSIDFDGLVLWWSIFTFDERGEYAKRYQVRDRSLTPWEMSLSELHFRSYDGVLEDIEAQSRPEDDPHLARSQAYLSSLSGDLSDPKRNDEFPQDR